MQNTSSATEQNFDYKRLDKVIHSRIRFAALCYLDAVDSASFIDIRDRIGATDGNLGVHLRKLEAAGYVFCDKTFQKRIPLSLYRMTRQGRNALQVYKREVSEFFSPFNHERSAQNTP
ncbi:MAG: transcriptional regulator [Prosthecochloris sp.]|nr:transcriptional regulator [Prosthecochloris sp.]